MTNLVDVLSENDLACIDLEMMISSPIISGIIRKIHLAYHISTLVKTFI